MEEQEIQRASPSGAPPSIGAILETLLGKLPPDGKKETGEGKTADPFTDLGDRLPSLLSDPSFLQQLPRIMALLRPLLSQPSASQQPKEREKPPVNRRDNLLLALKPFLSPERKRAVDTILGLTRLGTVLQHLQ